VLVLTRKNRQSIMIGDDIEIVVLSNDGTKVRLGIQAPQTMTVHRTEIYEQIQAESHESDGERRDLSRVRGGRAG
jgi:carbon storage regulator